MIDIIKDVRQQINFPGLSMRIGVHTVIKTKFSEREILLVV
jgi:hypothetical protein